jgi:hypothetical protein
MAEDAEDFTEPPDAPARRRRWPFVLGAGAGFLALVLGLAWFNRDSLADRLIAGQLEGLGLPATYEIERIGADRQVLRNVVIGDPRAPDMTIERVEVSGVLDRITLVRPRLYGSYRNGKPSFGSLDKVLFTGGKEPFRLPDLDIALVDGRARIDSDFGVAGVKLDGEGPLRGGFRGTLAAILSKAEGAGCRAERATIYGKLSVSAEKPRFEGPLRLGALACPERGLTLGSASLLLDATADPHLDGGEIRAGLKGGPVALGVNRLAGLGGTLRANYRKQALRASYDLAAVDIRTPQATLSAIGFEGDLRSARGLARVDLEGQMTGRDLALGGDLDAALASLQRSGEGTLAAPLVSQIRTALRREEQGSRLAVSYQFRRTGAAINLVVPQGSLQGASGDALLTVSRAQLTADGSNPARIAGNFTTGGVGLPRITGRLERSDDRRLTTRLAMNEYRAGKSAIAMPELVVVQPPNGVLGFDGQAWISGALPGGEVTGLLLPIDGNWSSRGGLALWRRCTPLRFDGLALANLKLDGRTVTLCPPPGGAILRSGPAGLHIAAGAPSLEVVGRLGASPIRVVSGPIGFAVPGNVSARRLDVALGPAATASRFRIANLSAKIGKDVAGAFDGSDIRLAAVPLDLLDARGNWRYAGGRVTITDGAFRLEDREAVDRFQPLVTQGATLTLANNRIVADAVLREPTSAREVVRTAIRHDLSTGRGDADLFVDGLLFDEKVQPDTVSRLALGVIANTHGTVRGNGRIDWSPQAVTSIGRFSTEALDFAAAFGPVKGLSGAVVFTDLLGMVTAPDQRVRIASVNPGIEVNDGELSFQLRPNMQLAINGAKWPFMGGTLTLEPTQMTFGVAETRRYTLNVEALDAAKFIQRLELSNLNATGIFDGRMPLVFDENGGRVENGLLQSRAPGGNVSYVGELTYKDLSAMGNFAFSALRSVDYRQMHIDMDGALAGEIVTRVSFDGLSQGAGTSKNFLTKKIARLPIRFNVNLRAPFLQLVSSFRSLYDTSLVRDPASLGLLDRARKTESIQPSDSGNER